MQLDEETTSRLAGWASTKSGLAALWLFGSRSRDQARSDSDFDLAIELHPKDRPDYDQAYTEFFFGYEKWKSELRTLVGGEVSLVCFREDLDCKFDPRVVKLYPIPGLEK